MRIRPLLLGLLLAGVVTQIVALMPRLTEKGDSSEELQPEALIQDAYPKHEPPLAPGIPQTKVPDYAIEQFEYTSTVRGQKQWKINAKRAFLYNKERIVSTRSVNGELYDPENQKILVEAKEAKYFMDGRDLELFGAVRATFPDGFRLESEYMLYQPAKGLFTAPAQHLVRGFGSEPGLDYAFATLGFSYVSTTGEARLPKEARLEFARQATGRKLLETTRVFADECEMHRRTHSADCLPYANRPSATRFVQIAQVNRDRVAAKARKAHLTYAGTTRLVQYVRLSEDVMIAESEKPRGSAASAPWDLMERFDPERINLAARSQSSRYSTSGRADFDAARDVIVLTVYPQVYQQADTVTGERILLHRNSDLVEIEHSNAYSEGQTL